jgi:hypothetical protein
VKPVKYFLLLALLLVVFYFGAIFLGFNLPGVSLFKKQKSISGDNLLEVTVMMDNKRDPVANVEVDVGKEAGPPPIGGITQTDELGVARFYLQPGTYVIFFNQLSFPKNLEMPAPRPVTVIEDGQNQITIELGTVD